jgi:hypothetical protein
MSEERRKLFLYGAERLRAINAAIRKNFERRYDGEEYRKAWHTAVNELHENYEALAFPGGLSNQMIRLRQGDPIAVERAVEFLEVDPLFFRSGYLKEEMLQLINRFELSSGQASRLRQVVIDRIHGEDRREFRRYCRLAARIATSEFRAQLAALADSTDSGIRRRAG